MSPPVKGDEGTYLPTGWRIVGAGAEQLAKRSAAVADTLSMPPESDTLYAVQFTAEVAIQGRSTVERVLADVTDEIRRTWPDFPRLLRDQSAERPPSRFGGLHYEIAEKNGTGCSGEILWRSVHPVVGGAPTTTRLFISF